MAGNTSVESLLKTGMTFGYVIVALEAYVPFLGRCKYAGETYHIASQHIVFAHSCRVAPVEGEGPVSEFEHVAKVCNIVELAFVTLNGADAPNVGIWTVFATNLC